MCSQLCKAKELPQELPVDLLTGLTLCLVSQFTTLFEHKLQQVKAASLEGNTHLSQFEIMAEVRVILAQAAQYYGSLNMSDYWNLPHNQGVNAFGAPAPVEVKCWNCGKSGHGLDKCKEARNDDKIAENRRKWIEANGATSKKKGKGGGGNGNYEREKWSPPKPGESGVCHIDGSHYTYCGKKHNGIVCGWTTSHSTSYHKKWASQGAAFNLAHECPTHELVLKAKSSSDQPKPTSPTPSAPASLPSTSGSVNTVVIPASVRSALSQLSDRRPHTK